MIASVLSCLLSHAVHHGVAWNSCLCFLYAKPHFEYTNLGIVAMVMVVSDASWLSEWPENKKAAIIWHGDACLFELLILNMTPCNQFEWPPERINHQFNYKASWNPFRKHNLGAWCILRIPVFWPSVSWLGVFLSCQQSLLSKDFSGLTVSHPRCLHIV